MTRERGLLAGQVAGDEALVETEAGVVHQQPDGTLRGPQAVGDALDVGAHRQVGDEHLGADACRGLELRREAGQPLLVAGHQDDVVLGRGQLPGELQAETCGRAGDECGCHGEQPTEAAAGSRAWTAQTPERRRSWGEQALSGVATCADVTEGLVAARGGLGACGWRAARRRRRHVGCAA